MKTVEIIKSQIRSTESDIRCNEKYLQTLVDDFKKSVANYTAYEIASGFAESEQRRIKEKYDSLKEKHETLKMLTWILNSAEDNNEERE